MSPAGDWRQQQLGGGLAPVLAQLQHKHLNSTILNITISK